MPLKIITKRVREDNEKPFYSGTGYQERKYRWTAEREGRSAQGIGLTEQKAIDHLKYDVQPDLNGELDGEGTPQRCIIGGNMFLDAQILHQNKMAFGKTI
jgi:hypothetical protein